ncbi:MAG: elongation factor P maturation arginine rhamnosyltransferase EarP [Gammaproteobacteria bacterium]|nr:elongation factor P maturation arginine rhamnosyltransferase EarP [Gammaproteobacteria bacterium]
MRVTWDIFCRVIDNFGDIGVTWRLAKQLQDEHHFTVRLWVDNLSAFQAICPAVKVDIEQQLIAGVEVRWWRDTPGAIAQSSCADVVIEAFACQLPDAYLSLMKAKQRVLWLNLEYLTAESWAAGCHALPSMQGGGLQKYFFFPGFTEDTGGLLREAKLLERRATFLSSEHWRQDFLASIGVCPQAGERLISLFAYANQALPSWLDALSKDSVRNRLLILQGPLQQSTAAWLGRDCLEVGQCYQQGRLTVQVLPYIRQENFDQLLWSCDVNVVRGEDSFVRAQWAGKTLLWHIYPQQDNAHLVKLEAFFALYSNLLGDEARNALRQLWFAWNNQQDMAAAWQGFIQHEKALQNHADYWLEQQKKQADLATKLACFYQNWL